MTLDDLVNGDIVRHIHMVSFQKDGQRLECIYSDGKITSATITELGNGRHRYLSVDERNAILDDVRDRIGESPVVSY